MTCYADTGVLDLLTPPRSVLAPAYERSRVLRPPTRSIVLRYFDPYGKPRGPGSGQNSNDRGHGIVKADHHSGLTYSSW